MVVRSREDAQVVGGGDGSGVNTGQLVANGGRVASDGSLLDIVAGLSTGEETLVAESDIDGGGGTLQEVEESTSVNVGLLEVDIGLSTVGLVGRAVVSEELKLEALGDLVVELELGVERVGSGPGLGQNNTCSKCIS